MAKASFVPLLTATTGLNNAVDQVRLTYDPKTGVTELAQAVNVNIDPSGRPSRRLGRTLVWTGSARCGFSNGEVCLFVSGSTLYQMSLDRTVTVIRSDLTAGARMRYRQIADRIYYINGYQKGFVRKGVDNLWSKGNYIAPGDTGRVYADPPSGHLVSWFAGRALVAIDNAILASEPSFYGVFDRHRGMKLLSSRITMMQPTSQGLWVGTTTEVVFYRGQQWEKLRRDKPVAGGVLEGSDAWCDADKLKAPKAVLFTTPEGICSGDESGQFTNLTFNKLVFPAGRYASAAVVGDRYLVLIEP